MTTSDVDNVGLNSENNIRKIFVSLNYYCNVEVNKSCEFEIKTRIMFTLFSCI